MQDRVPCVLISFEREHILMWRGPNWKSYLPKPEDYSGDAEKFDVDDATSLKEPLEGQEVSASCSQMLSIKDARYDTLNTSTCPLSSEDLIIERREDLSTTETEKLCADTDAISTVGETYESETASVYTGCPNDESEAMENSYVSTSMSDDAEFADDVSEATSNTYGDDSMLDATVCPDEEPPATLMGYDTMPRRLESTENQSVSSIVGSINRDKLQDVSETSQIFSEPARSNVPCTDGVLLLLKQAVESGSAIVLDDATLDADSIYERAVAFAHSAPPGPVFMHRPRKVAVQKSEKQEKLESEDLEVKEITLVCKKRGSERQNSKIRRKKGLNEHYLDAVPHRSLPQGSLGIDELAKLLS